MKVLGIITIYYLCLSTLEASQMYRAANYNKEIKSEEELSSLSYEASKANVDILLLNLLEYHGAVDNFDEAIKSLSVAAINSNSYVATHLYERSLCQNNAEVTKSNIVFDRTGAVISVYRKPMSGLTNCTESPSELESFTTDFGVTFGSLMSEDIVLHGAEYMKGLKNFVAFGIDDGKLLNGGPFFSAWSYVNNVNLLTSRAIFAGNSDLKTATGKLVIADLDKNGQIEHATPAHSADIYDEDLSQYSITSVDLEASVEGYVETVCQNTFCCEFYIKAHATGQKAVASYALAAFDGVQTLNSEHNIGLQNCMMFACAGSDKKTCEIESNGKENVMFEKITLSANYTTQNTQYPIIQTRSELPTENFKFSSKDHGISTQVTLELNDSEDISKFGLLGRDYSKDFESFMSERNNSESSYDIYDLILNEDVQEFFDYVWIRLRILFVVVSIYVLEMM